MSSKNIVITGANSGIGYETTLHFAREGANVVMACRNKDKAATARDQILAAVPGASITVLSLDVSDLESIRAFSRELPAQMTAIDVLVNNAGVAAVPFSRNAAGHEMQLATNYLGTFALTGLLLPLLAEGQSGRVVNVGSLAHRLGKLNIEDINWKHAEYNEWKSYANSKLAVMTYTLELDRRLRDNGSPVIALGAHPGFARTNIQASSPTLQKRKASNGWLSKKMENIVPSAERAARPIIFAVANPDVEGGDYYGPGGLLETGIGGKPGRARIKPVARDPELAGKLWAISESMTGVSYLSGD